VALKCINLSLKKQAIVSILGPNGAGKSTLIQLITDVHKLQGGKISYSDNDRISVCHQQEGLWEELTASELITIYSWIKGGER
jgi:ABC-type multidrug transport system ATPase subunit